MSLRMTKGKITRWEKDIAKARELLNRVETEVRGHKGNPMAKHLQSLCDIHAPLSRAQEWAEIAAQQITKFKV